jgi:hypothetical protein
MWGGGGPHPITNIEDKMPRERSSKTPKAPPGEKMVVFTRQYRGYNGGERAHFMIDKANALITAGVAVEPGAFGRAKKVEPPPPPAPVAPAIGRRAVFAVEGLGQVTGVIEVVPADGPITVTVGEGANMDRYEVDRSELTVLED